MKAKNQLAKQAMEQAVPEYFKSKCINIHVLKIVEKNNLPLICAGKISPINIHGMGPKPSENRIMNTHKDISGINPIDDTSYSLAFK